MVFWAVSYTHLDVYKRQEEFLALADYVSEIRKVKHPYDVGVAARRGIEY